MEVVREERKKLAGPVATSATVGPLICTSAKSRLAHGIRQHLVPISFQIAVTPTLIVTSENAMARFTPAERDCYSEDEISLKYLPRDHGYRYEMSNCLFESAFENILDKCKCFPGN